MSDNQPGQPDAQFWERANALINLANSQCDNTHRSEVSASSLYAVARFNAFIVAVDSGNAETLRANKEQALKYFVDQFRKMMTVNIDDFVDNYDKFFRRAKRDVMGKSRLEAFSDGVIAVIITILVLELKVPHGGGLDALLPLWPVFMSYVLSFIYVGIYWNNHHHLLQVVREVSGGVLWANLHLLFWLSLIPFVTAWMGENHFEAGPTAAYGVVLFMTSVAYMILVRVLIRRHPKNAALAQAIGRDRKGKVSSALYLVGVALSCRLAWLGFVVYVAVAVIWLIPDTRIEKRIAPQD